MKQKTALIIDCLQTDIGQTPPKSGKIYLGSYKELDENEPR